MTDSFKLALISADPSRYLSLVFPGEEEKEERSSDEVVIADGLSGTEGGRWEFEQYASPEEAEAMMRDLMADAAEPMSMEDMIEDDPDADW